MRALKILVVVMGVLIIAGTATLAVLIVKRAGGGGATASYDSMGLGESAGARIVGIAGAGDRLALLMRQDDRDWVVLVDPKTNAVTGRIFTGAAAKPAAPGQ